MNKKKDFFADDREFFKIQITKSHHGFRAVEMIRIKNKTGTNPKNPKLIKISKGKKGGKSRTK